MLSYAKDNAKIAQLDDITKEKPFYFFCYFGYLC